MLRLQRVSRRYTDGEPVTALNKISLEIKQGEFVAIIGPSGCGKSTLLYVLGLLDVPDEGHYWLDGKSVDIRSRRERAVLRNKKFGFVFQDFNLLPRTSAFDNVRLPLIYGGAANVVQKVETALARVGLLERKKSWPNQLSGGQQQRVAIARALVNEPEVILADEPTGNLDSKTGREIMRLFRQIHRAGKTIVVVTHNPELIEYATRIITMRDSRIVASQATSSADPAEDNNRGEN